MGQVRPTPHRHCLRGRRLSHLIVRARDGCRGERRFDEGEAAKAQLFEHALPDSFAIIKFNVSASRQGAGNRGSNEAQALTLDRSAHACAHLKQFIHEITHSPLLSPHRAAGLEFPTDKAIFVPELAAGALRSAILRVLSNPVAEGIESLEDWRFLPESGCTFAQGWLLARPMPSSQVKDWLKNHLARRGELRVQESLPRS